MQLLSVQLFQLLLQHQMPEGTLEDAQGMLQGNSRLEGYGCCTHYRQIGETRKVCKTIQNL